jgi:SAM-dependent methyltransferase
VPRIIDHARITAECRVLDVGCGTGGFATEIARRTGAVVTGVDEASTFLELARAQPPPETGAVAWIEADAHDLPFRERSFDRVLLSLVLHQLSRPSAAIEEAIRVLRDRGLVFVRTIAPDDAVARVPARYLPSMAAADARRMPAISSIVGWLEACGFVDVVVTRLQRNAVLDLLGEEEAVRTEVDARYPMVSPEELQIGIERMRAEAGAVNGDWIDPRPTTVIVAARPATARASGASNAREPA